MKRLCLILAVLVCVPPTASAGGCGVRYGSGIRYGGGLSFRYVAPLGFGYGYAPPAAFFAPAPVYGAGFTYGAPLGVGYSSGCGALFY